MTPERKARKRAQQAAWQRKYRADGRDVYRESDRCPAYEKMVADAQIGSTLLRTAIERAGLRP